MARAHLRSTIRDKDGRAIQNALVYLYTQNTTSPITDAYNAPSGGTLVTSLISNSQGEVECWLAAAKTLDLYVTDNTASAFLAGTPTATTTWESFRETVEIHPAPADIVVKSALHYFDIEDYGAVPVVGLVFGDCRAAIQAAIDAAAAAGGGIVLIPAGIWHVIGSLTWKTRVHIQGVGQETSYFLWTADVGAGQGGLVHEAVPISGAYGPSISNITLRGAMPLAIGVRAWQMAGIKLGPHASMTNVQVDYFGDGIVLGWDHNTLDGVQATNCYNNVLFAASPSTKENHTFNSCTFESPLFASLACAGSNSVSMCRFDACHFGFGPYGLYRADMGAASTVPFLVGCTFTSCSFELCGNAAILDESTGVGDGASSLINCTFDRCSYNSSSHADHRYAAKSHAYAVDVRNVLNCDIYESHLPFSLPIGGTSVWKIRGVCNESFRIHRHVAPPTPAGQFTEGGYFMTVEVGNCEGTGFAAGGAISWGDIVSWSGADNTVVRTTAGTVNTMVGIAMNDALVGGVVIVALAPCTTYVLCETIAAAGTAIRSLAGTEHHGTSAGANPIIGYAYNAGGGAGGALLKVRLRGITT